MAKDGSIRVDIEMIGVKQAKKEIEELETEMETMRAELGKIDTEGAKQKYENSVAKEMAETERIRNEIKSAYNNGDITKKQRDRDIRDNNKEMSLSLKQIRSEYAAVTKQAQSWKDKIQAAFERQTELKNKIKESRSWSNRVKKAVHGIGGGLKVSTKMAGGLLSRFRNMRHSVDKVGKTIKKVGFAMLGMRGAMGGIRQIVSSVMNNNEKLQKQLTAVKGVLGEAFAPAIDYLVQGLSKVLTFADKLYQAFTGTSLIAKYNAKQAKKQADATKDAADQEKKLQMASFDVANSLSDSSSSASSSSAELDSEKIDAFTPSKLTEGMQNLLKLLQSDDWTKAGNSIRDSFMQITNIDWSQIEQKASKAGQKLSQMFNGILEPDKNGNTIGGRLGSTLVGAVNTGLSFLQSFLSTFQGKNLGINISDFILKIFDGIPDISKKLGSITSSLITQVNKIITAIFQNINFGDLIGILISSIRAFLEGFNFSDVSSSTLENIGASIGFLLSGIIQLAIDSGLALFNFGKMIIDWIVNQVSQTSEYDENGEIRSLGERIIEGILNGIIEWLADIGNWVWDNILLPFVDGVKGAFNIHSPSKEPKIVELGKNLIMGVFNGIIDWIANVKEWFRTHVFDKITAAWKGFKELTINIGGKVKDTFNRAKEKWESVKEKGKEALATIKGKTAESFNKARKKWDDIKSKAATVTADLKDKITSGIRNILTSLCNMVNKVIGVINKIPGINIPTIKPPKLARGGIVNVPKRGVTATIGEAGAEAVLPLQNNTQWMDELAEKTAAAVMSMFSGIQLNNYMDSKLISREVIKAERRMSFARGGAF